MTDDQALMAASRLRGEAELALIISRQHQSAWHAERAAAYVATAAFLEKLAEKEPAA
jgi:2-keto-4-pentenoate hydratase/2-oxohepta-3-ene-1,7-dioic acid hydratase in catechol pathway